MKKLSIALIVLVAVAFFCESAHARTYRIAWNPWVGVAPLHIAESKGFWKEQGVDVILIRAAEAPDLFKAVSSKRADIMYEMIGTAVGMYQDGTSLSLIAETDWSNGGDKIIVKKNLDLATIKGKNVGVYSATPAVTFFLNRYLSTGGLKLADVKPVETGLIELTDNFINGMFPLIVCYDPEALRAEKEGKGQVVATSATYEGSIPEGFMGLKEVIAEIPKDDLVKIMRGWVKAVKWLNDPANKKEYFEIINSMVFKAEGPFPEDEIQAMISNVRIHDTKGLLERNRDGGGLQNYLKDSKTFLSDNKMLGKDFKAEDLFDNKAITEALKSEM